MRSSMGASVWVQAIALVGLVVAAGMPFKLGLMLGVLAGSAVGLFVWRTISRLGSAREPA